MTLIIAEKPELADAITDALSGTAKLVQVSKQLSYVEKGKYCIVSAKGHLLRLKEPQECNPALEKWSLNALPICFDSWEFIPKEGDEPRLNLIGDLLKRSTDAIHAGDPDDEGQLLIDEILQYFKYDKPVYRLLTNDNNAAVIQKELGRMRDNKEYYTVSLSTLARVVADALVGWNYSRFFTIINEGSTLSVGRVQTPALGLIVKRDYLIENHVPQFFYEIVTDLALGDLVHIKGKYVCAEDNPILEDKRILFKEDADRIAESLRNQTFVGVISKKVIEESPPLPFNQAKLVEYCGRKFGYTPTQVERATQSLRLKHKAITYGRTDSQYLNMEHFEEAPAVITQALKNLGMQIPEINYRIVSRCFNPDKTTSHHAIIPTDAVVDTRKLTPVENRVYMSICGYYFIQFLEPCKKIKTQMKVEFDNGDSIVSSSTGIAEKGYRAYCSKTFDEEQDENENTEEPETTSPLSSLSEGTYEVNILDAFSSERHTNPPARYSQHSLFMDLTRIAKYVEDPEIRGLLKQKDKNKDGENGGIGTAATRHAIIAKLMQRGYVEEKKGKLISTSRGRAFYNMLPQEIKGPDMTARWWVIQQEIKEGHLRPENLYEDVLHLVEDIINRDFGPMQQIPEERKIIGRCPRCGDVVLEGPKSFYCSSFKSDNNCGFWISKEPPYLRKAGKHLTAAQARQLVSGKAIKMKGLTSKSGALYDAMVVLENDGKGTGYVNLKYDRIYDIVRTI